MKHWLVGIPIAALVLGAMTTLVAQGPPASSAGAAVKSSRQELWRSNIETSQDNSDAAELQKAIERLRKLTNPKKAPAAVRRVATTRPASKSPKSVAPRIATTQPSAPKLTVKDRIRKINNVTDPAALADALFQAKRPDLAAVFYDRVILNETDPKAKAWSLFQAGNCRRQSQPKLALEAYEKLLAEYPKSVWSGVAKVRKGILEWRTSNDLESLLKDVAKQDKQSPGSSESK
jgi:tetratricopeptide (TPR) repeat protein